MSSYFPMVKNTAQRIVFPILDADGDPVTGAAADTPDSEYSLDGGSFSDCTNEISELATASGVYYLDLLTGETNGDVVAIQIKTATADTKTTVLVFYTSAQSLDTIGANIVNIETELADIHDTDLPAVKAETALIVEDTNEIQGKLPATKFMGSSDGADDDGTLNAITAAGPTKTEMDNAHAALATPAQVATELGTYDAVKRSEATSDKNAIIAAIPAMRGTDNVVLSGPTKAEMDTGHGLLATPAEVATEIADALKTDAMAETTQSIPSATPTIEEALMMLYTMIRNKKTVTENELGVYNDAGTKIHKKALADSAGTYTEDEMISGA